MEFLATVLVVAFVAFLVFIVKVMKDGRAEERSTASADGTIHDVFRFYSMVDRTTTLYWRIRYTAGGMEYGLLQEAYLIGEKEMAAHIGEPVTVHYDPGDPRVAWAETPGRHAYANDRAGYFRELGW